MGLDVRVGDGERTRIVVDRAASTLAVDRTRSGAVDFLDAFPGVHPVALPRTDVVRLDVCVDVASVEVLAADGEVALTDQVFPSPESTGLAVFAEGRHGHCPGVDRHGAVTPMRRPVRARAGRPPRPGRRGWRPARVAAAARRRPTTRQLQRTAACEQRVDAAMNHSAVRPWVIRAANSRRRWTASRWASVTRPASSGPDSSRAAAAPSCAARFTPSAAAGDASVRGVPDAQQTGCPPAP